MAVLRCVVVLLCATVASAQMPSFEEASVTPSDTGRLAAHFDSPAPDRFSATSATLRDLIGFAYGVEHARLLAGPDWIGVERFDIAARAERPFPVWSGNGPPVPLLLMVRSLLADRFGLIVHPETRELPACALHVARDDRKFGPEIAASKLTCDDAIGEAESLCNAFTASGHVVARGRRMMQFATLLSNVVGRVVLDRTQLPGTFDFRLTWTPNPNGQPLSAAMQEQLGLTLEPTLAPLEVLVIDRVEHPAAE